MTRLKTAGFDWGVAMKALKRACGVALQVLNSTRDLVAAWTEGHLLCCSCPHICLTSSSSSLPESSWVVEAVFEERTAELLMLLQLILYLTQIKKKEQEMGFHATHLLL